MARDWAAVFDLDTDAEDLLEHFDRAWFRGRPYRYLTDARHGVERGTAIFDDVVVRGYPSIPRALVLEPAVEAHFAGPIAVEEKLDGYNVRIARIDGDLLALTRSGFACPYTTAKVEELLDFADFFADYPEQMLCGELVGPENPYTEHDYPEIEEAAFSVFDIRHRETGDPMAVPRRRECCAEYELAAVSHYGTFAPETAAEAAIETVRDLDVRGREGVVLKSVDGERALKYTTSAIHRSDLEHAFGLPFDYGRDFLFTRVVREAFQTVEFDESPEEARERARKLGESILLPAVETIRAVEAGDSVGDTHTVRADPAVVEALLSYFRDKGLKLAVERDEREDDQRVVEFTKIARSTRDKTAYYLGGGTVDE
ncbi:RNA ligase [Haloarcula amylovorans]|uniref:RNA ligase n=1 Tax=Haloarcula amylovorans TaxID=2562280 RepID=UPI001076AE43|nr:RNA ligase [Halomicroarcula amylolytica]